MTLKMPKMWLFGVAMCGILILMYNAFESSKSWKGILLNTANLVNNLYNNSYSNSYNNSYLNCSICLYDRSMIDKFVIVTYGSHGYMDRAENLIGSINYWMPTMKIVFYDLGITNKEKTDLMNIDNVIYERFPFENYPSFIFENLKYYSWQPIILSLSAYKYHNILMEDGGHEFRQQNGIKNLLYLIWNTGYCFAKSPDYDKPVHVHPLSAKYLNLTPPLYQLDGGVVGISLDGKINQNFTKKNELLSFLHDYVSCALIKQCIAPNGSSLKNHRYSQTIQSLLIYNKYNFKDGYIERGPNDTNYTFHEWRQQKTTKKETDTNDIAILHRRSQQPKPYRKYINCNMLYPCTSFNF